MSGPFLFVLFDVNSGPGLKEREPPAFSHFPANPTPFDCSKELNQSDIKTRTFCVMLEVQEFFCGASTVIDFSLCFFYE